MVDELMIISELHRIDKDAVVKAAAKVLEVMSEQSFKYYKPKGGGAGEKKDGL